MKPLASLKGHKGEVLCVETSPLVPDLAGSGSEVQNSLTQPLPDQGFDHDLSLSHLIQDGSARLWDLKSHKSIRRIGRVFENEAVTALLFHRKDPHILFAAAGESIFGFDLRRPEVLLHEAKFGLGGIAEDEISQMSMSEGGNSLAVVDDSGMLQVSNP